MNPPTISAIAAAIVAIITAVGTYWHSANTRQMLQQHQALDQHPAAPSSPSSPTPQG